MMLEYGSLAWPDQTLHDNDMELTRYAMRRKEEEMHYSLVVMVN